MKIDDDDNDDVDAYDTMAGNWAVSSIGQREGREGKDDVATLVSTQK